MNKSLKLTIREMAEIAFLIALAVVLDIAGIKIGHASFTMVPLFVLSYRHGFVKSAITICFVYAMVTILTDGYSVNLVSLLFDYVLGYGVISLSGLFSKQIFKGNKKGFVTMIITIICCSALRVLSSTISGMILYELDFISSFWTNLTIYVGWDCLLALILLVILYIPLVKINSIYPIKK